MRFPPVTIRGRLLLLTLGLILPLVAAGFYNLREFRQSSQRQLNESIQRQAELAATAFEQQVGALRQTLETIADLSNNRENAGGLAKYLDSIVETRPAWLDVQIIDERGEVVLSQSKKKINLQAISIEALRQEVARENSLVIVTEQPPNEKLRLISLALPTAAGGFVVARIDGGSISGIFERLDLPEENTIAVFDSNNRLIYRSRASPEQLSSDVSAAPLLDALRENRRGIVEIESPYDKIRRVYGLAQIESADVSVVVGVASERLYEPMRRQFVQQVLVSLLVAAAAITAAFLIAGSIIRPLRELTRAARRFGEGDTAARADVSKTSPVGELGETFNQMATEIARREEEFKKLDRLKSEFVSNVSHELRTPLTTIKTLVRVLQANKISDAERGEFLETIAAECDRQIEFVQTLLDLSRIEAGAYKISLAPTDAVKVVREASETHRQTAASRKLSLKFKQPGELLPLAVTDAGALRQIISSLVENALKYTPEGGEIVVSANVVGEKIAVEIADDGCGIDPEDVPRIFEKFYRGRPLEIWDSNGETPLSADEHECGAYNETAGIGLGLYLIDNLVRQIGGEIQVQSPAPGRRRGAGFTVLVPIGEPRKRESDLRDN